MRPNGQTLYTANINSNTVAVFSVDPNTGVLTDIQTPRPTTGTDPNYVAILPNGAVLFTADAVADQLSRFTINADGTLTAAGVIPNMEGANGINFTNF
jgi:6-phosphogluconolactonase (cycloisomerase 2 family)